VNNCIGIINLDEDESKTKELVKKRPLGAVPIGARYRIIDFALSNMTNSGIENIGIFSKSKCRALMDHLKNGKPWDLHRKRDGLRLFNFGYNDLAFEDVRNFAENIEFIKKCKKDYVIMTPSYMICNIDYNKVLEAHKKSGKDITVVYKHVDKTTEKFSSCDLLNINNGGKLVSVEKYIKTKESVNVSMEMYIMSTELFIDIILKCIGTGLYRKVKEYIASNLNSLEVGTYEFKGFLCCINSLESYYRANIKLLDKKISKELFNEERPIYTKVKDEGPTFYGEYSKVNNSIIANGCCIEGEVTNSVIGRRVIVEKGAKINNCVILQNTVISRNSKLENIIVNKGTCILENKIYIGDRHKPKVLE